MPTFQWNEKYSVSVQPMDYDHQKLFVMIDALHESLRGGKAKEQIFELINQLRDYTVYHFNKEEALMAKINYPGLPQQKTEHAKFVGKITEVQKKISDGGSLLATVELSQFLNDWLRSHIMEVDKKYAQAMNSAGIN